MGSFKRYRDTVLVVLLLAVPFFFLRASIRNPENMTAVDRAIVRLVTPLQYASATVARGVSSLVGDYVYLVDVKADNNKLAFENARLRTRVRELASADAENQRLRRLLSLRETLEAESVSAVVVAKDTTDYFRVLHLVVDKPNAAIRQDMPVVTLEGAVGIVHRVSGDKVDVTLAADSGFAADVIVERTGARGFVRGVGDGSRYLVRVEYALRSDQIEVGDLLLTSGLGCRFPKGIPVARVSKVDRRDFGNFQAVEAVPTVDFSRLEEVLILLIDGGECSPPGRTQAERRAR